MAVTVGGIAIKIDLNAAGLATGAAAVRNNIKQVNNVIFKMQQQSDQATDSVDRLAAGIAGLSAAFASKLATDKIQEYTVLAARAEVLGTILNNVGQIAGKNVAQLGILEDRVKALGITTIAARKSLTLLAQSELDLSNSTKLARVAQDAAVIAGINSSEAFERLLTAIQRGNSIMLRNLGIIVNLNQLYQSYAVSVGRTVNTLTPLEKRQLILNEVFRKGALIAGTYEASLNDVYKRFTSLDRFIEEAQRTIGENFLPVFENLVTSTENFAKAIADDPEKSRFIAQILAMSTAFGGLTAVASGSLVAIKAFSAIMGPSALAVGVLTFALAALAGAYISVTAAGEQAKLEQQRYAAAVVETAQAQAETNSRVEELQKLLSLTTSKATSEELERIRVKIEQIGDSAPELGRSLKYAFDEASKSGANLGDALGTALGSFQDNSKVKDAIAQQKEINKNIEELAEIYAGQYNISVQEANRVLKQQLEQTGNLDEAVQGLQQRLAGGAYVAGAFDLFSGNLANAVETDAVDSYGEAQQRLIDRTRVLSGVIAGLNGQLKQSQTITREAGFDDLKKQAVAAEQAAEAARNQIKLVSTERRKIFKETNVQILDDFSEFISKAGTAQRLQLSQVKGFVEQEKQIRLAQVEENFRIALQGEKDVNKRAKLELDRIRALQGVRENALTREKELTDDIIQANKGLAAAVELANLQLQEQAETIAILEDEVLGLESGLDQNLTRIQKKFQKETKQSSLAIEELNSRINSLKDDLRATDINSPTFTAIGEQIKVAYELRDQLIQKQALLERKAAIETFNERKKQLEQFASREEEITKRLAELRGRAALNVLDSVQKLYEAQKKAREEVDKFISSEKLSDIDPTGKSQAFFNETQKFLDTIEKARPDQLDIVQKLYPKASQKLLADVERSFAKIDRQLNRFTEDSFERAAAREQAFRDTVDRLTAAGTSLEAAQFRAQKEFNRDLEDEADTRDELTRRQQEEAAAKKQIQELNRSGKTEVEALIALRRNQLDAEKAAGEDELNVRTILDQLKDKEIAKNETNLEVLRKQTEETKKQAYAINALLQDSAQRVTKPGQTREAARLPNDPLNTVAPESALDTQRRVLNDALGNISARTNVSAATKDTLTEILNLLKTNEQITSKDLEDIRSLQKYLNEQKRAYQTAFASRFRTTGGR